MNLNVYSYHKKRVIYYHHRDSVCFSYHKKRLVPRDP